MGEVRLRVKITNTGEEYMFSRGHIPEEQVHRIETDAVVDTGAVRSVMPRVLMDQLGLREKNRARARYADGRSETVIVSEAATLEMHGREVSENFLILGDEVMIGQTALEATDLLVDSSGRQLVPNPAHPDGPVIRIR